MGVSSPKLSLLTTDKGIKLMLAPEAHSTFPMSEFPSLQGIVKLPGSCISFGKEFWIIALQVAVRLTLTNFLDLLRSKFEYNYFKEICFPRSLVYP